MGLGGPELPRAQALALHTALTVGAAQPEAGVVVL